QEAINALRTVLTRFSRHRDGQDGCGRQLAIATSLQPLQGRQASQRRKVGDLRVVDKKRLQSGQASQRRQIADLRTRDIQRPQGRQASQRCKIADLYLRDVKHLQGRKASQRPKVHQAV